MVSPDVVVGEAVSTTGLFGNFDAEEQEQLQGLSKWMLSKYSSKVPWTRLFCLRSGTLTMQS